MASTSRGPTPPGRYGDPSRGRRAALMASVAALVVAFLAFLAWAAWHQASEGVSGEVTAFSVVSPHAIRVTLAVERPSGDAVVCTVEARAADHGLVGSQDVTIPAGAAGSVAFEATIRTDREATSAAVAGCRR